MCYTSYATIRVEGMKLYTSMPKSLKPFYGAALSEFRKEREAGNLPKAWSHLEKAHILGQRYPCQHSYVHWKMLQFGFKIKNRKEVIGQIPRLLFGGIKSFVGRIPVGNPGGANVPPLKPFPIEKELQEIFLQAGIRYSD
jgi:hypothetical protein